MKKTYFFDMDGTLIDSIQLTWDKVILKYLHDRNIPYPKDMIINIVSIGFMGIANYYIDEAGENVISETDMEYKLKIRTTTNLPLEYKLYKNQGLTVDNLTDILDIETVENENMHFDDDNTIFKYLVLEEQDEELKAEGITDNGEFLFTNPSANTYILEFTLPATCNSIDYQNIIECIEITVDSKQIID